MELLPPGELPSQEDAAALTALRERPAPSATAVSEVPAWPELLDLARRGEPEQARRALSHLAEAHEETADRGVLSGQEADLRELLDELLVHPKPRVRLHAHRISRRVLDKRTYLEHTSVLLDDPQPDVVRSAIKTLCHAGWKPAIPAVVGLLAHSHPGVRRTAADGLARLGRLAIPALRRAADHARPDKRPVYQAVLDRIHAAGR